ncbi:MAG TPA: hypothetical protein VMG12_33580, partial [Polyangiaceae bacterium]|nr:hypothetical protein [Polyangiaceae bacterium]
MLSSQGTELPALRADTDSEAPLPSTNPPPSAAAAPAPAPRREPSERLSNVERLRIVAMLEIVTFHVGGAVGTGDYRLPIVGGLGLPVFLLLNNA